MGSISDKVTDKSWNVAEHNSRNFFEIVSTDPEDCKAEQEMLSRWSTKKKVTFVDNEVESKEIIEAYEEPEVEPPNNELFSLMDLNKMKMLKKLRNASGHSSNL